MMSKAELARKAGLSTLTIDRVEAGRPCRLDTKRKILLALGLKVSDKDRIFSRPPDVSSIAARSAEAEIHTAHGSSNSTSIQESMSTALGEEEKKGEAIR